MIANQSLPKGIAATLLCLTLGSAPVRAFEAFFPAGAERTVERIEPFASYPLPIGPWADGSMLVQRTEGRVEQSGWRIPAEDLGTLALLAPLRKALDEAGWRVLFDCETEGCGGFDFRYDTQVLPEPEMHVDLRDFRFISARKGPRGAAEYISLLVSRSAGARLGYVQMIHVTPVAEGAPGTAPPSAVMPESDRSDVAVALEAGSLVLEGLSFETGAAGVTIADPAQLGAVAAYLESHPEANIALVGHTDASGGLDVNVALSKRRAEAVRERLVADFGVAARRVEALGAGYMAPRASNQTEEGRAQNRRVEVILTSTP